MSLSPPKLRIVPEPSPAEKREANDAAARLELKAYKSTRKATAAELAEEFGYSPDAAEKWLTGKARVPGGVVYAIVMERLGAERKAA
jgi:hypothetical protein